MDHRIARLLATGIVLATLALGISKGTGAEEDGPDGTPCAVASPVAGDTILSATCGNASSPRSGSPVALSTPLSLPGDLVITLQTSSDRAGPHDLTVLLTDSAGIPVSDAVVTIAGRHLGMDHGRFPHEATLTAPGTYVAEYVGLGMEGTWRLDITINRPGQPEIIVFIDVELQPHAAS